MKEDYCSFELSKLLKEKGLKGITRRYFYNGGLFCDNNVNESDWNSKGDKWVSQPTHQMAMKWLREKDVDIIIMPLFKLKGGRIYCYEIHSDNTGIRTGQFKTYEEAVEAAIKYVLENLI